MKYSVAVVDDHVLLSQAIGKLIEEFEQFEVMYLCNNGQELIDKIKAGGRSPDLVLMDVNMPILNGIETTAYLTEHYPDVHVLALSIEEDEFTILKMLRAGAKGYLMKDSKKDELENALLEVAKYGYYHTNTVARILVGSLQKNNSGAGALKEREIEFIKHVCTEKTYKEIADEMCLSHKTIEGYRNVLFEKLNLRNRTGLVLYAIRNKIFVP